MSLTGLLNNKDVNEFFKKIKPNKNEFYTLSGKTPFSNEYEEQFPYGLDIPYDSTLIGTAFDYLARFEIARSIKNNKADSYKMLYYGIPKSGLNKVGIVTNDRKFIERLEEYLNDTLETIKKYVNNEIDNYEILLNKVLFLARLEHCYRMGWMGTYKQLKDNELINNEIGDMSLDQLEKLINWFTDFKPNLTKELKNMLISLRECFIKTVVNENSLVIFNPTFGKASELVNGADADIYIDGTLYDFKTTKKYGYVGKDVYQIVGYYLLKNIDDKYTFYYDERGKLSSSLFNKDIDRIAFYKVRFGEIEYLKTSYLRKFNKRKVLEEFESVLKNINPNFDSIVNRLM